MLAVAAVAAYVSYWHAYAVVRAHGETGITARPDVLSRPEPPTAGSPAAARARRQIRHGNREASPRRTAVHPGAQCGDQAQEGGAVNDEAVAAYRLSVQAGNPLSERKLARMFGHTSRRWARARITEARQVPSPGASGDSAVTAST